MRQVQVGDVLALAGAISGHPDAIDAALRLCAEAHAAHAFMKRHRRLHPRWGNGSLMSRVYAAQGRMLSDWSETGILALTAACLALTLWRRQRLDCPKRRLYGRRKLSNAEAAHGRDPAQTRQHRPGLGARL